MKRMNNLPDKEFKAFIMRMLTELEKRIDEQMKSVAKKYETAGAEEYDTRNEKHTPYHGSRAMRRSPLPLAWRPDFPGAPREAH